MLSPSGSVTVSQVNNASNTTSVAASAGAVNVQIAENATVELISGAIATAIAQTSAAARVSTIPLGMGQEVIVTAIEV